ncbi:hypothetical protein DMA11_10260 [Marinilabiliaceae bacterium JC017]|nr:hypothetical protein DMA11_10260 [Marinilabiliaceae bacterium JC017]
MYLKNIQNCLSLYHTHTLSIMASGIITTVKLEPFFKQFLRSHFEQENDLVFTFPKGHDLQKRLNLLLIKKPIKASEHNYGEESFEIELYYMEGKDVRQHNYISETAAKIFARKIKEFYSMIFHEFYNARYRFFTHKEIVYQWMEQNCFDESAYDRIERDARRYRRKNYNKNYYQKKTLKNVKSSPVQSALCPG